METAAHPRILFKPRTFGMIFVTLRSSASLRTGVVKTFRCADEAFTMPLSAEQTQKLFRSLERNGWYWRDDTIYAPNETMWLCRDEPWVGDIVDFYERMCGRRSRIHNNRDNWDAKPAVADVDSLVAVLDSLQPN